jgi:hypothetical protein
LPVLLTSGLWNDITSAAKQAKTPAHVAVAYFGERGPSLLPLPKGSSIVVDASIATVAQGSTSPAALERLRYSGVDIYTMQNLHAKVYAFDDIAFVGSANASLHSANTLLEAVLQINTPTEIAAVRTFVGSLCLTQLNRTDLKRLQNYYQKPKSVKLNPQQQKYSTLLMELTNEQGGGRETQVQPPKAVWETFFGLQLPAITLPSLTLVSQTATTTRQVVRHHHIYTIEILEAELPRPAILQMRRIGLHRYWYAVHRPGDPEFAPRDRLVRTLHNPLWQAGRRWVLV